MRKKLLTMLAVAVLLGFANLAVAQSEMKPVVTVSFSGYDELMNNIGMFGRLGGNPDVGKGLEFMLQMMTQGKGLAGLDKSQPWGAVYLADDQGQSTFYGFLPVTDLKQLVETAQAVQLARNVKQDNGVYEIQSGQMTIYARQEGKWAIIGRTKEDLAKAPADPLKLLGEMPKNYDLAVRASVRNLPKEYREQFLAQFRAGIEAGMMRLPDETDEQYELRVGASKQALQQIATMVNDLEDVLLGWNVDTSAGTTYIDLELTAQSGTKLVDQFALMAPGKTKFAGFLMPQAALTANWVGTMSDDDVAQAKSNLATLRKSLITNLEDQGLSEDEIKLASKLLDDVHDFLVKTIEAKKSDGGLALLLEPEAATLVAGGAVVEGGKLDKVVEELAAEMKQSDPEAAKSIKLNADSHEGVRFHSFTMPTPQPELEPMVGDQLEVVLGISDERVYLAAGRNAAETLKKVIDQSKAAEDKEVPPMQISLSVGTIAKFIAGVAEDEQIKAQASALADALSGAGGKDHVTLTATPIAQGVRLRLEVEEELLKALATMGQKMAPMGQMPPGGGPPR